MVLRARIRLTAFMTVNTFGVSTFKNQLNAAENLSPKHRTLRQHTACAVQELNVFQKNCCESNSLKVCGRLLLSPEACASVPMIQLRELKQRLHFYDCIVIRKCMKGLD